VEKVITEYKSAGKCEIDRAAVIKRWTLLCRIAKTAQGYFLIECTPKGKEKVKVSISKEDAEYLIDTLSLSYVRHPIFGNMGTFLRI